MKTTKLNHYSELLLLFKELRVKYPSYSIGRHIATAFDEYKDVWGVPDKELLNALIKYKTQLELDEPHLTGDEELEEIMKDSMDLHIEDSYFED